MKIIISLLLLLLLIIIVVILSPYEKLSTKVDFNTAQIGDDLEAYLIKSEAKFDDIRFNTQKQIKWAGKKGTRTRNVVVYLHGFSSSLAEIRPVPDHVARALKANLYFTRMPGHGRSNQAMADVKGDHWVETLAETMEIARRLGDKIYIISTSTGSTIATVGFNYPSIMNGVAGLIFVSPNYGLRSKMANLLRLPYVRTWGPWLFGKNFSFRAINDRQEHYWTTSYPLESLVALMTIIKGSERMDVSKIMVPALFYYSEKDDIVDPRKIINIMKSWGGPTTAVVPDVPYSADRKFHIITGDIIAPERTDHAIKTFVSWIKSLE